MANPNTEPKDTARRSPEPSRYGVIGQGVTALNKHHSEDAKGAPRYNTSTGLSDKERQGPPR